MTTVPGHPDAAVVIRPETTADVDVVRLLVGAAFAGAKHSAPPVSAGGPPGEVDLLGWLRQDEAWLPNLSLVAVREGQVVGHVVCTRAHVGDAQALGLGPVSVLPALQGLGIGTALVREALVRAESAGETLVALLGDPAFYARFGFVPAQVLGVTSPDAAYGDYFQALALGSGPHPRGQFRYAAPFDRL